MVHLHLTQSAASLLEQQVDKYPEATLVKYPSDVVCLSPVSTPASVCCTEEDGFTVPDMSFDDFSQPAHSPCVSWSSRSSSDFNWLSTNNTQTAHDDQSSQCMAITGLMNPEHHAIPSPPRTSSTTSSPRLLSSKTICDEDIDNHLVSKHMQILPKTRSRKSTPHRAPSRLGPKPGIVFRFAYSVDQVVTRIVRCPSVLRRQLHTNRGPSSFVGLTRRSSYPASEDFYYSFADNPLRPHVFMASSSPYRNQRSSSSYDGEDYDDDGVFGGAKKKKVKRVKRERATKPARLGEKICASCSSTQTPIWREVKEHWGDNWMEVLLCNACGLRKFCILSWVFSKLPSCLT